MNTKSKLATKQIKENKAIKGGADLNELAEQLVNLTVKDVKELA